MHPILRNILAVILGLVIGSVVNMAFILLGPMLIPPPEGADVTTTEGLKAALPMFEWKHFIFPFLAHAVGSLCGAAIAAFVAADHKMNFAMAIGFFFLMGGIANVVMLPAPAWFSILDLVVAYIPMAYLAGKWLGGRSKVGIV